MGDPAGLGQRAHRTATAGEVAIRIEATGRTFSVRAADTAILVASAYTCMPALNRYLNTTTR